MKDLSSEDLGPLKKNDLKKGASLMADYKGKSYPVHFEAFAGEHVHVVYVSAHVICILIDKDQSRARKKNAEDESEAKKKNATKAAGVRQNNKEVWSVALTETQDIIISEVHTESFEGE